MAIIYYEGFDSVADNTAPPGWTTSVGLSSSYGRFGGKGIRGSGWARYQFPSVNEIIVGCAVYDTGEYGFYSDRFIFGLIGDSGETNHVFVRLGAGGNIDVRRGAADGAQIVASANGIVTPLTWGYLEAKVTIHDTTGTIVVRWNGVEVINYTGDTKNGGTANSVDSIVFQGHYQCYIDDVYLIDTGTAPNQTWLGDIRVVNLSPNGNGTYSQGVGSDGNSTDNYLLVDESPPSTTDYVTIANGNKDSYTFQDLNAAASATIHAVGVRSYANKTSSGWRSIKNFVDLGGTISYGATRPLPANSTALTDTFLQKPGGGAWTTSDVNAIQAGAEAA